MLAMSRALVLDGDVLYTPIDEKPKQTAEPLAKALGIPATVVGARDMKGLLEKVKAGGNALVVGHSNTVGTILEALGVSEKIALGEDEYDNLFVVVTGEKPTLVRLRFETGDWFAGAGVRGFWPHVEIAFDVTEPSRHHHVPLLLSPFGYSTYRGS